MKLAELESCMLLGKMQNLNMFRKSTRTIIPWQTRKLPNTHWPQTYVNYRFV